jgi:hypothetical protein
MPPQESVRAQPPEESRATRPALDASVQAADYDSLKRKVKAALVQNLASDETIKAIIRGAHGQAMIGTERRVFVCKPGFMAGASFGAEVTSWSYQNLLGVQAHKGMLSGAVVLQGPGQTGTKTSYWQGGRDDPRQAPNAIPIAGDWPRVNQGVARLRQLIDDAHRPVAPVLAPATTQAPLSTADELRKLADLREEGILSEEEFESAKAQLLSG